MMPGGEPSRPGRNAPNSLPLAAFASGSGPLRGITEIPFLFRGNCQIKSRLPRLITALCPLELLLPLLHPLGLLHPLLCPLCLYPLLSPSDSGPLHGIAEIPHLHPTASPRSVNLRTCRTRCLADEDFPFPTRAFRPGRTLLPLPPPFAPPRHMQSPGRYSITHCHV